MEFLPIELGAIYVGAGSMGGENVVWAWRLRETIKSLPGAVVAEKGQGLAWDPNRVNGQVEMDVDAEDHERLLQCAVNWAFFEPTPAKIDMVHELAKTLRVEHQFEKVLTDGGFLEQEAEEIEG